MFRWIRSINRTNSRPIWTRICEDIAIMEKNHPTPPSSAPSVGRPRAVCLLLPGRSAYGFVFSIFSFEVNVQSGLQKRFGGLARLPRADNVVDPTPKSTLSDVPPLGSKIYTMTDDNCASFSFSLMFV